MLRYPGPALDGVALPPWSPAVTPSPLTSFLLAALGMLTGLRARADEARAVPTPGPHAVGFRVVPQVDRSRVLRGRVDPLTGEVFSGERGRPLQTLLWYPAAGPGAPLRYRDYLATRLTEISLAPPPAELQTARAKQEAGVLRRLGPAGAQVLEHAVRATADAPQAPGSFPLVLYAPGAGGSADENADLCEHLASHGYFVVASTSLGASDKAIPYDMAGVEPQVRDLQFLLAYAHGLAGVDLRRIAVVGWSWGGMANVFAAARDERIGALVSLDGTREPALTRQIDVRRLTAPWLYFSRTPDTIPQINQSGIDTTFSLLNEAKHTSVTQVILYPFQHADFTSARLREAPEAAYRDYTREEVRQAYGVMVQLTRAFLDAHLKGEAAALALFTRDPRELGAAPHSVRILPGPAPLPPPTRAHLAETLARVGFAKAVEEVRSLQAQDKAFTLAPEELQAWGYGLLGRGRTSDAVEIFKLWTVLHPGDWNAFDSLGEGYEAIGKGAPASEAYARSLALNPANRNAADRMKALAEPAPKGKVRPGSR